jgi:hypothetical protein
MNQSFKRISLKKGIESIEIKNAIEFSDARRKPFEKPFRAIDIGVESGGEIEKKDFNFEGRAKSEKRIFKVMIDFGHQKNVSGTTGGTNGKKVERNIGMALENRGNKKITWGAECGKRVIHMTEKGEIAAM